jgi:hypothetical protein
MQAAVSAVFIVAPVIAAGWLGYRKLWWTLTEYRPHVHSEEDSPLHSKGIRFPRAMRDKDGRR